MKVNLLRIDECEKKKGRGFMKRMKEAWDEIDGNNQMSAQTFRDNAVRFHKKTNRCLTSLMSEMEKT